MSAAEGMQPAMRFVVYGEGDQVRFCCPRCGAKEARLYAVDVDDGRVRVVMTEEHNRLEPGMVSSFALTPPRELRVVMHFVCSAGHDFFYQYRVRGTPHVRDVGRGRRRAR